MYIESDAWVTNLKQKLACGSILISNKMEYYEWFTRGLSPGVHYVEVDSADICEDTLRKARLCCRPCSGHAWGTAALKLWHARLVGLFTQLH